jgi:uronate dehydrogenase
MRSVLLTGAAGNLGGKLRRHLEGRYRLLLLDIDPKGDPQIVREDLSRWSETWVRLFEGVDVVVHLAANPDAHQTWPNLIGPNIDATLHMFEACARGRVKRVVYASSLHVLTGYRDVPEPALLTPDTPPRPGCRYIEQGEERNSMAYAAAKLLCERVGRFYAEIRGLAVLVARLGWVLRGENRPETMRREEDAWLKTAWLSNRDYCQFMQCCIEGDPGNRFAIVHGVSANTGARWDWKSAREAIGYRPQDDLMRVQAGPVDPGVAGV